MENMHEYLIIEGTVLKGIVKGSNPVSVVIPKGITEIGESAFDGCPALESIAIPASVTKIEPCTFYDWAFGGCRNFRTVQYEGTLEQWCEMENDWSLMKNAEHVFLSDGTDIKALTELVIPEGVAKIESCAFRECKSLISITIPESVTEIAGSFEGCINIKTVKCGHTLAQWCEMKKGGYLMEYAESVLLGDGTDIKKMTELVIPEGVAKIGDWALEECAALTSVVIPESVTEISQWAFSECKNLKTVQYGGTLAQWCEMKQSNDLMQSAERVFLCDGTDIKDLTELVVPEGVAKIGRYAFSECVRLTSVVIHESVTEIGSWAFEGCKNLNTVQYGGTLAQWCAMENDWCLMQNTEHMFLSDGTDIKALTKLVIPAGVAKIGENAFKCCAALETVTIPEGVTEIGRKAFENCTALKSVTIPKSVTKIYAQAFRGCTALTNVTAPENVTVIGYRAFGNCTALESVTIPKSVTQIGGIMPGDSESPESGLSTLTRILENTKESGYLSFEECPKLKDVYYNGTKEQWRELMKHGSFESTVTVHCSDGDIV